MSNTYYYARLLRSSKPDEQEIVAKTGIVWPDQAGAGAHINISGGGVLKSAPHKANAIRFLEYLASDQAQVYFADGNNEWPAVKSVNVKNPALETMGTFKADALPIAASARTPPRRRRSWIASAGSNQKGVATRRGVGDPSSVRAPRGAPRSTTTCGHRRRRSDRGAPEPFRRTRQEQHRREPDENDRERRQRGLRQALVARELVGLRRERVEIERPHDERGGKLLHHVDEHQQERRSSASRDQRRMHAPERLAAFAPRLRDAESIAGVIRAKPGSMPFQATAK